HDLAETFANLNRHNIKLNGARIYGQRVRDQRQPREDRSHQPHAPPTSPRDIQSLTGHMAALSCFISRLGDRSLSFFKALRKHDNFEWTQEAQEAFDNLKRYLSTTPLLTTPKPSEVLLLYLTMSP